MLQLIARRVAFRPIVMTALALSFALFARDSALAQMPFRRGDIDGDGNIDYVADAVYFSEALFGGGPPPPCFDAADVTDDGSFDLADMLLLLNSGFVVGAPPIPPPHPNCGLDPTADSLNCLTYDNCSGAAVLPLDPAYELSFVSTTNPLGTAAEVRVLFDSTGAGLSGWSFGVCHDIAAADVTSVSRGATIDALSPDFEVRNIVPGGWTAATLLGFAADTTLSAGLDLELYIAQYALLGASDTELSFCGTLGDPVVPISFTRAGGGGPSLPVVHPGIVGVEPTPVGTRYRRGDANADTALNIGDAIWVISYVFQGGAAPPCRKAADANDDGGIDIADAIWLINYYFAGGAPPPTPFPACGIDPTPDALTCAGYPLCPAP
ncbi:MAG: dockerin type I repeat-containing protein [Planctomycetota bacterium]